MGQARVSSFKSYKMKKINTKFYEKYWKIKKGLKPSENEFIDGIKRVISDEPLFEELPVWGKIEAELDKRVKFFDVAIKGKILDAGCGSGEWVLHLAKFPKVSEAVGVDVSEIVIKECIKRGAEKKKAKFVVGSVTDLPFKANFFDTIFSFEVAEHILDVDRMFAQFNRALKKGGYLGISTVDFNLLKKIIIGTLFFEKYFDLRSPHIRFFTRTSLEKLLVRNGFKVEKYKWIKSYFGLMPMGQIVLAKKVKNINRT